MSKTPFTVYGRHRVTPSMQFPAGTKYDDAVAAFEAAHPDFAFDRVVSLVEDQQGAVEEFEGECCDACGHFVAVTEDCGADADGNLICAECVALYRAHRSSAPPMVVE